jgi:hypothetical protein
MKNMKGLKNQGGWFQYAIAAAGAISSIAGGKSAKRGARRLAAANIAMIEEETTETLSRMEKTHTQLVGEATATAAASGFTNKGSQEAYFDDLDQEYTARKDWTQRSADQRKKVAALGGSAAASQAGSTATAGVLNAANNAASWYYGK